MKFGSKSGSADAVIIASLKNQIRALKKGDDRDDPNDMIGISSQPSIALIPMCDARSKRTKAHALTENNGKILHGVEHET